MKPSPTQMGLVRELAGGHERHIISTATGRLKASWVREPGRRLTRAALDAIRRAGYLQPRVDPKTGLVTYHLSPAGHQAAQGGATHGR